MSGIVALSAKKNDYNYPDSEETKKNNDKFISDLFWLTFYLQHLGQEYGGLATANNEGRMLPETHRGLFRPNFEHNLQGFSGPLGIGHIGDSFCEPISRLNQLNQYAICFSGHLINKKEIVSQMFQEGHSFSPVDSEGNVSDVEVIAKLINKGGSRENLNQDLNFVNGLNFMTETVEGSYVLAILTPNNIYVVRGPDAHEFLVQGSKNGITTICTETTGFYNQGFKLERDIEPGEIVSLKDGVATSLGKVWTHKKISSKFCSFKKVYTEYPASLTLGISAAEVRRRLGAQRAAADIASGFFPDVVIPVPDSGRFGAIGYHQEFIRQAQAGKISVNQIPLYDEILTKYPYSSRSYTPAKPAERQLEAQKKLIPLLEDKYAGKKIVVFDDSIVRGTQSKNDLVPKIKAAAPGAEIHFRISNPKLVNMCNWTKSNKKRHDLAAVEPKTGNVRSDEAMARNLDMASCHFNSCQDLAATHGISLEHLCVDCDTIPNH